jgi:hypothetical protein
LYWRSEGLAVPVTCFRVVHRRLQTTQS